MTDEEGLYRFMYPSLYLIVFKSCDLNSGKQQLLLKCAFYTPAFRPVPTTSLASALFL